MSFAPPLRFGGCRVRHDEAPRLAAHGATADGASSGMQQHKFSLSPKTQETLTPTSLRQGDRGTLREGISTRTQNCHESKVDRRVRIDESMNEECDYISRMDMTEDEILDCWYDECDLEELQLDAVDTVRTIRRMRRENGGYRVSMSITATEEVEEYQGYCSRGLEHVIDLDLLERRKAAKENSIEAVLTEQEALLILWEEGRRRLPNSDEIIAEASRKVTREAVEASVRAGQKDATVARNIAAFEERGNNGRRLGRILREAYALHAP